MTNRLFNGKYFSVDVDLTDNWIDRFVLLDSNGNFISDWYMDFDDMNVADYMRLIFKLEGMTDSDLCEALADEFNFEAVINPTTTEIMELAREYDDDHINIIGQHILLYRG